MNYSEPFKTERDVLLKEIETIQQACHNITHIALHSLEKLHNEINVLERENARFHTERENLNYRLRFLTDEINRIQNEKNALQETVDREIQAKQSLSHVVNYWKNRCTAEEDAHLACEKRAAENCPHCQTLEETILTIHENNYYNP